MRKLSRNSLPCLQSGIALVENLIAIVLLSVGAVGIALSTATAIKVNSDNQARAMALEAATKELAPVFAFSKKIEVYDEIKQNDAYSQQSFATTLRTYVAKDAVLKGNGDVKTPAYDGVTVQGNLSAGASDDFMVSISQALDANDKDVLNESPPYESPVRVAVVVTYAGIAGYGNADGGQEISDTKRFTASFTYVLK